MLGPVLIKISDQNPGGATGFTCSHLAFIPISRFYHGGRQNGTASSLKSHTQIAINCYFEIVCDAFVENNIHSFIACYLFMIVICRVRVHGDGDH